MRSKNPPHSIAGLPTALPVAAGGLGTLEDEEATAEDDGAADVDTCEDGAADVATCEDGAADDTAVVEMVDGAVEPLLDAPPDCAAPNVPP